MKKMSAILLATAGLMLLISGTSASERFREALPAKEEPILRELSARSAPEPRMEAGPSVMIDGRALEGGSYRKDGAFYIKASDLSAFFDGDLTWTEEAAQLVWEGGELTFSDASALVCSRGESFSLTFPVRYSRGDFYLPEDILVSVFHMSRFYDEEYGRVYYTHAAGDWEIEPGYRVPVIMYHAVSDNISGVDGLFMSPPSMAEQLRYLAENGFDAIWFEDLENIEQYDKPVILTFDDGYLNNYSELFPLLQKYGIKATFFVITDWIGGDVYMNEEQIREVCQSGLVSVQSHTATHPDMTALTEEEQRRELERSKLSIVRLTGKEPMVICYPFGRSDSRVEQMAKEFYRFGIKMGGNEYVTGDDTGLIYRYSSLRGISLSDFISWIE